MLEQEQSHVGKLVQRFEDGDKDIMVWQHETSTRFELPEYAAVGDKALVDRELIYTFKDGKWVFDATEIYTLSFVQKEEPNMMLITNSPDPVAGIDFSSKPRNEWTIGNWIAHVGGGIRSDHFVVFGSVMAVDMMIRQIVKCQLKQIEEAADSGDLRVIVQGGTKEERIMMWAGICGMIEGIDVKSAPYLQSVIDELNAGRGLNGQKTMEFLSNFSHARELLLDIAKDISTGE